MPKGQYDYAAAAKKRKATLAAKAAAAAAGPVRRRTKRKDTYRVAEALNEMAVMAVPAANGEPAGVPVERWQELCERHNVALDLLKRSKSNEEILCEHIDKLNHQLDTVKLALAIDHSLAGRLTPKTDSEREILRALGS